METNHKPIDSQTTIGSVALTIPNLEDSISFYTQAIGLELLQNSDGQASLGAGGQEIVRLVEMPGAQAPGRATGLYHMAIRVPTRLELARALRRLVESETPLQGFADHAVSEAIYLADPDGNGIEIYRDRPREEWSYSDGQIRMTTDPLDIDGVLAELKRDPDSSSNPKDGSQKGSTSPGTVMGHVHLKVKEIPASEDFYVNVLGFDRVLRYGPSAAFVSAGGYHHHIGMNTWESAGAPPAPENAIGLRYFTLRLSADGRKKLLEHLSAMEIPLQESEAGVYLRDPSGNKVVIEPASST